LIAAEIVRAIDANPALSDTAHGETSPAPVCLEMKDLREAYDVTTPDRVWLAFNWLTHRRGPAEMLGDFRTAVEAALGEELARQSASRFAATGDEAGAAGTVLTFDAVRTLAAERGGKDALDRLAELEAALSTSGNPLEISRRLVA